MTGGWRNLHNEELHDLHSLPNIRTIMFRRMRLAGHEERMGKMRNAYETLDGNPEGNKQLGKPKSKWEDNIKMDFREIRFGGVD
jgi:hypothetical protein